MSDRSRTRRKRRQDRAALLHGWEAKPRHCLPSGRTGIAHTKKVPKKQDGVGVVSRGPTPVAPHGALEGLQYSSASEAVTAMRKQRRSR